MIHSLSSCFSGLLASCLHKDGQYEYTTKTSACHRLDHCHLYCHKHCQKRCRNRGLALGLRPVQAAALPGEDQADAPEKPLMQLPGVSGPFAVPPPLNEARGSRPSPPYTWLTAMLYSGLLW